MEATSATQRSIHVIACKGCGSAIAEAFLTLANLPYEREEIDYAQDSPARERLRALNPLVQVPTLILPDGAVLTETLAIAVFVDTHAPEVGLIPNEMSLRLRFWRWATFLVAAVYPTFTYGDSPEKWVKNADAQRELRASTDERRELLLRALETECQAPYFLGTTFSAIDLYLGVMSHWRPTRPWFEDHAPKIAAASARIAALPELRKVWAANFE
jgi:GST-like protein